MIICKRLLSVFLSFSMCLTPLCGYCEKQNTSNKKAVPESEVFADDEEMRKILKSGYEDYTAGIQGSDNINPDSLPVGYDQRIVDDINNNPLSTDFSESEISGQSFETFDSYEKNDPVKNRLPVSGLFDTNTENVDSLSRSASSEVPEEFEIQAVNSPFNVYSTNNESVSLATGAMNYEKNLISLPGRNGFDLNISVRYNSDDAVITENEYDNYSEMRNSDYSRFAIGWSYTFPTVIKGKKTYGYKVDTSLRLADGSTYKIINDSEDALGSDQRTLGLENYLLEDISLVRDYTNSEYVLTYSDGTKEHFDDVYGLITKREDRFGNFITYEYDEIRYYRGTFDNYINNPSFYSIKLYVLSKITDSAGRVVNIEYTKASDLSGSYISKISFKVGSATYASLNLSRCESFNGKVDILRSISDGEGLTTSFEYDEKLAFIYSYAGNYESESYSVNGSNFLLTKINYYTGGYNEYTYEKFRRSYGYYDASTLLWYEVYKVTETSDSEDNKYIYKYESDRSGYPYSRPVLSYESGTAGHIYDQSVKYHTIIKHKSGETVHTFDYKHNKITENSYYPTNSGEKIKYIPSKGDAAWNVVYNYKIYKVDIIDKSLFIYSHPETSSEVIFYPPCDLDEDITVDNVKTSMDNILVFYKTNVAGGGYKYNVKIFNITDKEWSDGSSYTADENINLKNMYYTGNIFYSYGQRYSENSGYIDILTYNPSGHEWEMHQFANPYVDNYDLYYICAQDSYVYFKVGHFLSRCDIQNDTAEHISMGTNIFPLSQSVKGLSLNGKTYFYTNKKICEFDFLSASVIKEYPYPFDMITRKDRIQKSYDYAVYYFAEDNGVYKIYQFRPDNENPWQITSYRMFDNDNFNIILMWDFAYITLGYNSGLITGYEGEYYDLSQRNSGGFEKISLPGDDYQTRIKTDNVYNEYNQLISTTKSVIRGGQIKTLTEEHTTYVNGRSVVLSHTDALGNVTSYDYTGSSYYIPVSITAYSGTVNAVTTSNTLSEDKTKILSSVTAYDDRSLKTVYSYDSVYPANLVSESSYEIKHNEESIIGQKDYVYDSSGIFVITEKAKNIETYGSDFTLQTPSDIICSYEYDSMGRLVKEIDAKGNITSYIYNKNGWLTQTNYPDNSFVQNTYTVSGGNNSIKTSYNNQYITVDRYNGLGQLEEHAELNDDKENLLAVYIYSYNEPVGMMKADGTQYYSGTDYFGRFSGSWLIDSKGQMLKCTEVVYDELNSSVYEYDGRGKTTYYDNVGRVIKEEQDTDAGLNSVLYEYDYQGNVSKTTDALGASIINTYNDMGQLISVTDPLNQSTVYEYDKWGNVSKVTYSGGNSMSYLYDNAGRLIKTTDVLGNSEYYVYDANGNLIGYKDRNSQTSINTYNNMDRLISKQVGSKSFAYTYDSLGNQLTMTDETGTTAYEYTYNNLVSKITTPDNKTISYTHNLNGNVVNVDDYAGNEYSYTYDGAGRLITISSGNNTAASYTYTVFDAVESVTTPEFMSVYTYDNAGRMTSQTNTLTNETAINSYDYTYNLTGNRIKKEESANGVLLTTNYTYDSLGRLTAEQQPDGTSTAYTFDAGGNIASKNITHPSTYEYEYMQNQTERSIGNITSHIHTYTYNTANRLVSQSESVTGNSEAVETTKNYTYDSNGNMLQINTGGQTDAQTVSYAYNELNQLVSHTAPDGTVTTYGYDGTGMRVSKTQGENTTKFYWDRGYVSNEGNGASITASYIIAANGVIAGQYNGNTDYYLKNGHGDIVSVMRNSESQNTYNYDAYGNSESTNSEYTIPFGYCGEYTDAESGLIYLRARYYDPEICRFISEDPIMDGTNWYSYCEGNPVMFVDPWGLFDYNDRLSVSNKYNIDVAVLQNELAWLKLYSGDIDGYFGQKTLEAVNKYKAIMGLGNTGDNWGVVGKQTWESLGLIYRTQEDINAEIKIATVGLKQYKDVSVPINTALVNAKDVFSDHKYEFIWFYNQVKEGAPWDIKSEENWNKTIADETYPGSHKTQVMLYGTITTPEALGNITYGYLGTAAGFSQAILLYGGDAAANGVQLTPKGIYNGVKGILITADSQEDKDNIIKGINWYKK